MLLLTINMALARLLHSCCLRSVIPPSICLAPSRTGNKIRAGTVCETGEINCAKLMVVFMCNYKIIIIINILGFLLGSLIILTLCLHKNLIT